jgi:ATP-dependent Zn protease
MATAEASPTRLSADSTSASAELAQQWRRLTRAVTVVAAFTAIPVYLWYKQHYGWAWWEALLVALGTVIALRGLADIAFRRMIPWPSLFGSEDVQLREEDVVARRRSWFWRFWLKLGLTVVVGVTIAWLFRGGTWFGTVGWFFEGLGSILSSTAFWMQIVVVFFLFIANFMIFFGPLLLMNISQIRGFEPGDAEWGVKLADVRGQAEAKEEIRRVVSLWQSGEHFERAGGKRERGLLFNGAPGTGKTMLAKAIATGFNSPFVSIPGSGFAATFIGIDAIVVRYLARKAKRLARKWGGTCIVFIDEIDAVGMRRQAMQGGTGYRSPSIHDFCFHGPWGALNSTGDLIVETPEWRERLFEARAPERRGSPYPPFVQKFGNLVNQAFPGMFGGMGGQLALNQLLVVMDGIDNPPFMRRVITSKVNTVLDASFIVPRRMGRLSLRLPAPRPRGEQVYFIGATNVPLERLDPALTRPGRMGRHVWFRTPTKEDRKDIFDLYLGKVAHDPTLDTDTKRDEIARITSGYSPAMIDQICSMALTYAHHDDREAFGWEDLLESMTTIESGTAINIEYVEHETRAVAIHEAGHAAAAHAYRPELESSRISIRMRGGSLGHHLARSREERFSRWKSEDVGDLIHTLGAMAAERVFYGENSGGVGGDLETATTRAALMVGTAGMGPEPIDVSALRMDDEDEQQARERVMKRFEHIGLTLMNRTRGSADFHADPIASVLNDPAKRQNAAQILGQAYVTAENFIRANREHIEAMAGEIIRKREIYGDELVRLLERQHFVKPVIDYGDDATWPKM